MTQVGLTMHESKVVLLTAGQESSETNSLFMCPHAALKRLLTEANELGLKGKRIRSLFFGEGRMHYLCEERR